MKEGHLYLCVSCFNKQHFCADESFCLCPVTLGFVCPPKIDKIWISFYVINMTCEIKLYCLFCFILKINVILNPEPGPSPRMPDCSFNVELQGIYATLGATLKGKWVETASFKILCCWFMSYRPATLLTGFWFECLDSFIQGKIFLLIANFGFCCFDLRGNVPCSDASTCCWGAPSKPLTPSGDSLKRSRWWWWWWWMLCEALLVFCISIKRAQGLLLPLLSSPPFLTLWRSAGSQMSHGRFPQSRGLLGLRRSSKKRKKTETESGRRLNDPSYQLNSMLTWIASLSKPERRRRMKSVLEKERKKHTKRRIIL